MKNKTFPGLRKSNMRTWNFFVACSYKLVLNCSLGETGNVKTALVSQDNGRINPSP